ncbi:hypothetical protein ACH42_16955 [Endozoicomonas sp. (ex Bugula neritina AB1)]|nr:hypothetical protein ACH42_16955 [Endozoicomonas sp. (ex Bugula neritina AB1)]
MFSTLSVWLKRLLVLVVFLVLLVFFVNFTLSNTQLISLDLAGIMLPEVTLSTLVLVPFVLGGLLGLLVSAMLVLRMTYANKSLGRKLARRDNEIQKLRSSTLKGLTDA